MSEEKQYPSLGQQAKNLAKFSWELINYIHRNQGEALVVSDEVYNERVSICNACDKFDKKETRCTECGCFIPAKAKIILDSCPLNKWGTDIESWEKKFEGISEKLDKNNN